jgi:hypothetical protein
MPVSPLEEDRSTERALEACGDPGEIARLEGSGVAADYAAALLGACGVEFERSHGRADPHPALDWARSGAMELTGRPEAPPRLAPGPLAACARGALTALRTLAGTRWRSDLEGPEVLGERAAIFGLTRRGVVSPGGSCRLLPSLDGWIAVNLARPDDVALLPAWFAEAGPGGDPWAFVAERVAKRSIAELVERARLLGLPVAEAGEPDASPPPWLRVAARGERVTRAAGESPLVVDLSSLWAGPLCTQLLGLAGARVVKVESLTRPDGARRGRPAFFDRLNAGKPSVALDFGSPEGRRQLRALVERADLVVESARPRALAQLGLEAEALVAAIPGLSWVSITGYGRREPQAGWVAFGDDAAAASGLAAATGAGEGTPLFCGDAIADPLTGLHAAVAAWASWRRGGGQLLDLALRDVTAHALGFGEKQCGAQVRSVTGGFEVVADGERAPVLPPRARTARDAARPLGADTHAVLRDLRISR